LNGRAKRLCAAISIFVKCIQAGG